MNPRTHIRKAIKAILSDEATGFNASLAQVASLHGAEPFEIDFGDVGPSRNFFQGYFVADEQGKLLVFEQVPAMCLYTTGKVNLNTHKNNRFSGEIKLFIDVYLRFRQRDDNIVVIDSAEPEALADACEDALLFCMDKLTPQLSQVPPSIQWNGDMAFNRSPIIFFGDGFAQLIQLEMTFGAQE